MHLAYAWRLAVRKFPVILALAVAGLVIAFGYTSVTATYSTTTYLTVLPTQDNVGPRAADPQRFFETETRAILSDQVLGAAVTRLPNGTTVGQLRQDVQLSGGSSNDVLGLTITGHSKQSAQARQAAVLAAVTGSSFSGVTMTQLWTSPVATPSRLKLLLAGLAAGAAVGVLLVLLWGAARRPVYHPRYLQLGSEVRTYPVVIDLRQPDQVQQFLSWLGRPASHVVAVGGTDATARQLAAQVGVDEAAGGPTLLVASPGQATEQAVEDHAALTPHTAPPVLVLVSSKRRKHVTR